jgi:hypothetical protein
MELLTTPNPPPVQEWGVKFAYAPLVATGVALAVGASASLLALTPLGAAMLGPIFPLSAIAAGLHSFTALGAVTAFGGPAAILLLAVTTAVFEGLNVVAKEKLPDQLQAALDEAYVPPDLAALLDTEEGTQEVFGVFTETTVPPLPPEPRHPVCPKADARFVHFRSGSQHTDFILNYKTWGEAIGLRASSTASSTTSGRMAPAGIRRTSSGTSSRMGVSGRPPSETVGSSTIREGARRSRATPTPGSTM